MSKLSNFIEMIPTLCESELAEVRGFRNSLVFEYELKNKDSAFARKNFKNDNDRLKVLFDFEGDYDKKLFCEDLLKLKMYIGYQAKKIDEDFSVEISTLKSDIESNQNLYPEIVSVYSLEDASNEAEPGWY